MEVNQRKNCDIINQFNKNLSLEVKLPENYQILNPYESEETRQTSQLFFNRFFNDSNKRNLLLGINPGRLGAGYTGIPFTDPKHVKKLLGVTMKNMMHEPSSVFVYDVIDDFGGPEVFYTSNYISSVCPLGFTTLSEKGRIVNRNYYDHQDLLESVKPFVIQSLKDQLPFLNTEKVFILGTSQNYTFFKALNNDIKMFEQVIPLPHPRFVMQYKLKKKEEYIKLYQDALS